MKRLYTLTGLLLIGFAALALDPVRQTLGLKIDNTRDEVKLTIQSKGSPSNNIVEIYTGSTLALAVPPTAIGLRTNIGLQAGTCVTTSDGTVTQAFGSVFSAAPVVVTTQKGIDTTPTNIVAVTTSNFVLTTSLASQTNDWIAVGTPLTQSGP